MSCSNFHSKWMKFITKKRWRDLFVFLMLCLKIVHRKKYTHKRTALKMEVKASSRSTFYNKFYLAVAIVSFSFCFYFFWLKICKHFTVHILKGALSHSHKIMACMIEIHISHLVFHHCSVCLLWLVDSSVWRQLKRTNTIFTSREWMIEMKNTCNKR